MTPLSLVHIPEPLLEFGFGQKLVYPRDGLFLYGPVDGGRPELHYGAISTPAGLARLERWTGIVAGFIPPPPPRRGARLIEPQHVAYPGFGAAFNTPWPVKPRTTVATIDGEELAKALRIVNRNEAIKAAVDIYVMPLIGAASRIEDPPTFWFVVIPEEVYELSVRSPKYQCRSASRAPCDDEERGAETR